MHTRLRLRPLRLRRPIPYVFFLNVSFLNIDSSSHSRRANRLRGTSSPTTIGHPFKTGRPLLSQPLARCHRRTRRRRHSRRHRSR